MTAVPYWSDGDATVYVGDCREILPELPRDSVDLIVTDHPAEVTA
jgi:DNA modification methylase